MNKMVYASIVPMILTCSAFAQSQVTVYGKVDLGLVMDSGSKSGKSIRLSSGVTGGSRLGFKGAEDLGGGMQAAFTLETGYCADSAAGAPNFCTGSNNFMGRQAHLDLSGSLGALSAGRRYSLGAVALGVADPFGAGFAGDSGNGDGTGIYLLDPSGYRLNNSVSYTTPVFGGFSAAGELSLGEKTGSWKSGRESGAAATYATGPVYAAATYYDLKNANGLGDARKVVQGGGTYNIGVAKIHAFVQRLTGNPTGTLKADILTWMAGASVPLVGGLALASFIHHDDRGAANHDASQLGVGYVYPLSKRTSVYTSFAHIANSQGAAFTVGNATETGTGPRSFDLGLVHNF